ncbi:MAG TPA: methyltransferase domain-containing protein [Gammaproteobacteria bacterium]|nr:methyltransferase domain-containing protein [Gammaproteobacteria bacterium]
MQLSKGAEAGKLVPDEREVYQAMLPLDGARVLELGCGKAVHTRAIAESGRVAEIVACEVDEIQQRANMAGPALPRVTFRLGGAEVIDEPDASFDIVLMFKSLHHIPGESLDQALGEIHRVLRPGGLVYLSEPVFAGAFNEILRLFHDEEGVRRDAFEAMRRSIESGRFELVEERFFRVPVRFADFAEFDVAVLQVTHTRHELSPDLRQAVRERFEAHWGPDGACFSQPLRVDLLRRPADGADRVTERGPGAV